MTRDLPLRFNVMWDGNETDPELMLSASAVTIVTLGERLRDLSAAIVLPATPSESAVWPRSLDWLRIEFSGDESGSLRLCVSGDCLTISADAATLQRLGESLVSVFGRGAVAGAHLHVDAIAGWTEEGGGQLIIGVPP